MIRALPLAFVKTTMTPSLPPEILDLIFNDLLDEPITLRACCLVSKAWVSPSRRLIFACIELDSAGSSIDSWTRAFPDPSSSPAHHARSLYIRDPGVTSANVCAWISSFRHLRELTVNTFGWGGPRGISFVQLRGLSPTLRSLHLSGPGPPIPEILGLICSFPLLEDLSLYSEAFEGATNGWTTPSTSPKLTGSLRMKGENRSLVRELLNLPDGLHFSKIRVEWRAQDDDSRTIMDLVSKCSDTLESLYLEYHSSSTFHLVSAADQFLTPRYP